MRNGFAIATWIALGPIAQGAVDVDLSKYKADCGVGARVVDGGNALEITWPRDRSEAPGRLVVDLRPDHPRFRSIGTVRSGSHAEVAVGVEPAVWVTVGSRENPPGRPPGMSVFNVFFDNPASRPHRSFASKLDLTSASVRSDGKRATVALGTMTAGPFRGELEVTVYAGSKLLHVEAVLATDEDRRAYLYDAGLLAADGSLPSRFAWIDTEGRPQSREVAADAQDTPLMVRHRVLAAGGAGGSIAAFPPPHQYFFPRDYTDNLRNLWYGRDHRGLSKAFGFGIRQSETGGGNWVPWVNAPPRSRQRMGIFYLVGDGSPESAIEDALAYTRRDQFADLPGRKTFATHWHMAITMAAMQQKAKGVDPLPVPDLVRIFKDMNVDLVHLGEFHGDGHPDDPGPKRLPEMAAMFEECKRLSDEDLLLIPGEEANAHLGLPGPGRHPGHWMLLFPKPIIWVMKPEKGAPFVQQHPTHGTVYNVADRHQMLELLRREGGLAWTAHPRIKASNWTPDVFKDEDFYKDPTWLGAAWKAMPADNSSPRLGDRVLDLMSDMANWGPRKAVPGEVDVFKIDHTHELYGHMNINYLKLEAIPRFDGGWKPVLDALRSGDFFTTTGEILIEDFRVGGVESGREAVISPSGGGGTPIAFKVAWTFPLRFAEIVTGDGVREYRDRVDLSDTTAFGSRTITLSPRLAGRRWARLEAWDVAANGAYTQPVWLTGVAPGLR